MFRFLGKNLLQKRNLMLSPVYQCLIRFISTDSLPKNNSFAINYLINTFGLSQQKAQSVSKRLNFQSPTNPDKVVALFKNNGFSDPQISRIIAGRPQLLVSSVDESLIPKFQFFDSMGFSGPDITNIFCSCPVLLSLSLNKSIIPFYNLVKDIVGIDAKFITIFKRTTGVLNAKVLASNVSLLRDRNVPAPNIATLLVSQPRVLLRKASRFNEIVKEVEKMKFDPSESRFLLAVQALDAMSRSSLEAKFDVYRSWGLSEEEVQCVFRTSPICMLLSEKNIMSKMDYFVNKLGYTPSSLAKQPSILHYSFERIVSRCSLIQVLITKGQLKKAPSLCSFLSLTEERFSENYISKFEKEVPELLSMYHGTG